MTGEFVNPARDLPRVIHTGMPAVIIFYLLANLAYYFVLPASVINSSNTVAVAFGQQVFGPVGAFLLAMMVAGSSFGALNATTFTSGRLVYAAGKEGYLPAMFGRLGFGSSDSVKLHSQPGSKRRSTRLTKLIADEGYGLFFTPINAMLLNASLTALYILVGEFSTLITFYGVAGYTFYFFTVLGVIVLRVKEPDLDRPYKTWITTPIIFCCVSLFLLSRAVFAQPLQTLVVVAFIAVGVPLYFLMVRRRGSRSGLRDMGEKGQSWKFWRRWGRG